MTVHVQVTDLNYVLQVGMALEPGGMKDQLITAAADGEMKMVDFRMLGDASAAANGPAGNAGSSGSLGVWKTVNASATSRNLSALAAHPNAPLLATGTATQARLSILSRLATPFIPWQCGIALSRHGCPS